MTTVDISRTDHAYAMFGAHVVPFPHPALGKTDGRRSLAVRYKHKQDYTASRMLQLPVPESQMVWPSNGADAYSWLAYEPGDDTTWLARVSLTHLGYFEAIRVQPGTWKREWVWGKLGGVVYADTEAIYEAFCKDL